MVRGDTQVGAPVEWVVLSEGDRYDELVYGQRSRGQTLSLGANECYFYPVGPRLQGGGKSPDDPEAALFNKGERYEAIGSIRQSGQQIKWPFLPTSDGAFEASVFLRVDETEAGSVWIVSCGDLEKRVVAVESDGRAPQPWSLEGNIVESGRKKSAIQFFTVELEQTGATDREAGVLKRVELNGSAIDGAYAVRSRWRPQAVHTRFGSSTIEKSGMGLAAWIVEIRPHFDFEGDPFQFYAPVTTEFGYYGSTFMPTGEATPQIFTAKPMNFSLWSYKRGAAAPPVGQLSHLLAIGDPNRLFGGYHHEGTGVKPRGLLPEIEGRRLESLVLGMRFDAPNRDDAYPYRTYHAYFLDPRTRDWKLYASGRKFTDDPERYGGLRAPGSFVEVPGRVVSQRTHQSLRSASYRGWLLDTAGNWSEIDSLSGSTKIGEIAPKRWEVDEEGWFRLTTGGMVYRRFKTRENGISRKPGFALPDYMRAEALEGFLRYPVSISTTSVKRLDGRRLAIEFELKGNRAPSEIVAHFGREDGLTLIFEDGDRPSKWEGAMKGAFPAGTHRWIATAPEGTRIPESGFCRLLANTEQGRFWALESDAW